MITFNLTPPEEAADQTAPQVAQAEQMEQVETEWVPQPAPMRVPVQAAPAATSNLLIPFLVVSFGMFALGAGGTLVYVNSSSRTAQPAMKWPAATVVGAVVSEEPEAVTPAPVAQAEEAVTRAATTPAYFEAASPDVEGPQARAAAGAVCVQSLGALPASGAVHLDLARALAREAQGCTMVSITVQGYANHSDDEIENLRASWQEAEGTIATLAAEGLDVSGFRPLGVGSRGQADEAGPVSFHIAAGF